MAQLTIYLDDAAERRVKAAARKSGLSVSRWIAELVEGRARTDWPPEVRELAGAWPDFSDFPELRALTGKDLSRLRL
ncbi:MAG: CopG family transcriptional regulator [Terriglobia bacterium]